MLDTTLIILCAGNSTRFNLPVKKQWIRLGDEPLWLNVANRLSSYSDFKEVVIVSHQDEINYMKNFSDNFTYVIGGNTRQQSIQNALKNVSTPKVMVTDVARCCVPKEVILELLKNKNKADCIVPFLKISDTVVYEDDTINRDGIKLIQTPQLSDTKILKEALNSTTIFTDDSSAIKNIKRSVYYIDGSLKSTKLTFGDELKNIDCLIPPATDIFVGTGIDIHPFETGKEMFLGGVKIRDDFGFKAHSDGDVLIHSVIDAILGAMGAGDIGEFFPDTDPKYKGANSKDLLKHIVTFCNNVGYVINNIDLTILAQIPKINPHKNEIKTSLAKLLNLPKNKINIKATTTEKLGFIGRKEAIAVLSVASLKYFEWTKEIR